MGIEIIYEALINKCKKVKRPYLKIEEARYVTQMTSGYSFPTGTTIEDILNQLGELKLIAREKSALLEKEIIIPLEK